LLVIWISFYAAIRQLYGDDLSQDFDDEIHISTGQSSLKD